MISRSTLAECTAGLRVDAFCSFMISRSIAATLRGKQTKQLQRLSRLSRDLLVRFARKRWAGACRPLLETTLASGRGRNNRAVWQVSGPETDPPASTRALTMRARWPRAQLTQRIPERVC